MKGFVFLGVILLWVLPANGAAAPEEFKIAAVKLQGVENISPRALKDTLAVRARPFWRFWQPRPTATPADLEDDLLRIRQFYQKAGYYDARATYGFQEEEGGRTIVFSVEEGAPVRIRSLDLKLTRRIGDLTLRDLRQNLDLEVGQVFQLDAYQAAKQAIAKRLANQGYPRSRVEGKVMVNPALQAARIEFSVDPGPLSRFGEVHLAGNDQYVQEPVIRRALTFRPGELYSQEKVDESQRNLFELDLFTAALIQPAHAPEDETRLPMEVKVKPRERNSLSFGIGYGNEDGVRAKAGWTYRNLFDWGGRFSVSAKRSDLIRNLQADFAQPYFLDARTTLKAKAGFEEELFESHITRTLFQNTLLERRLDRNWSGSAGYNLELSRIEDLDITDPEELEEVHEGSDYVISSVAAGVVRSTVRNEVDPDGGTVFSTSLEYASAALGSQVDYLFPSWELKAYLPLPPELVLAGRLRYQTIQAMEDTDEIPIFKRLWLGGSNTVRGYGFQMLGPLDKDQNPVFGLSSLLANLELRYPIYEKIEGVVFLDMGMLARESFRLDLADLRYACGLGLRYQTVLGPVRLDVGYKLNPPTLGEVADNLDPAQDPDEEVEDRWKIHISFGHSF